VRQIVDLCNEYGMDAMAVAKIMDQTMSLSMTIQEKLLSEKNECEPVLPFGSVEAILDRTRRLGEGEARITMTAQSFSSLHEDSPAPAAKKKVPEIQEDLDAVIDSLGMCAFTASTLAADDYRDLFNAATGAALSTAGLLAAGRKIREVERRFQRAAR
jgi:aldehyde:ferredoxin oxidoreductase